MFQFFKDVGVDFPRALWGSEGNPHEISAEGRRGGETQLWEGEWCTVLKNGDRGRSIPTKKEFLRGGGGSVLSEQLRVLSEM